MQRFQFSPERTLAVRRLQREQERAALLKCHAERAAIARQEQAIRAERQSVEEAIARSLTIDASQVGTLAGWQARVRAALTHIAGMIRQADERIAQQQARLQEAERRVKLLERLRERRLAAWQTEADREREALAAEAYLARLIRERRSHL